MERYDIFLRGKTYRCAIYPHLLGLLLFFSSSAPVGVTKEMDKIVRNFVEDGGDFKHCSHLVKWDWTSLPIQYGGLGINLFCERNNAFLLK